MLNIKVIALLIATIQALNVLDFGTVTQGRAPTADQEFENAKAFELAMLAANASATDRQVLLPKGTVVSIMPTTFTGVKNVQLTIEGTLLASQNFK